MSPLRVAVYDLYWSTLGGGEQVDGTIAQVLAEAGHDVTLLGPEPPDVERIRERLGVDLSSCGFRRVTDDHEASAASADADVFVNGTYLSQAVNRAPVGLYYVHFPRTPPSRTEALRSRLCVAGLRAVRALPVRGEPPLRLREVAAGFDRRIVRTEFLGTYTRFLANSAFTARWVERLWGVPADALAVLHPPVRPGVGPGEKRPLVVALGRFFDPAHGHSKKQLDLVEAFVEMERTGAADGWELALAGGCGPADREYALAVRRAALGHRIDVHVNARGEVVESLLAEASLFWHAAGLHEDPERHPDRFEHFGIALVEAMAAGAVPVVFGSAGPAEIVADGVSGRLWQTPEQLRSVTAELMSDAAERARLADGARTRAADFAAERFAEQLLAHVDDLVATGDRRDRGDRPAGAVR